METKEAVACWLVVVTVPERSYSGDDHLRVGGVVDDDVAELLEPGGQGCPAAPGIGEELVAAWARWSSSPTARSSRSASPRTTSTGHVFIALARYNG
jgi:hypothetical protein